MNPFADFSTADLRRLNDYAVQMHTITQITPRVAAGAIYWALYAARAAGLSVDDVLEIVRSMWDRAHASSETPTPEG